MPESRKWLRCKGQATRFQNSSNFKLPFPLLLLLRRLRSSSRRSLVATTGRHMFVHLRCHSHYSFLRGVNPPEEIIAAAVEQKMTAVALTDTNGMYAAVPFYQAARAAGVKPIVGVTLEAEFPQANSEAAIPRLRVGKSGRLSAPFGSAQGKRDDSSAS